MGQASFPLISIDGGAGTGKTTVAAQVARRLGICYADSGAGYRAVALALRQAGVTEAEDPHIGALLTSLPLRFQPGTERLGVILAGREVGEEIRTPEISRLSSRLAVRPEVRELVTSLLRAAREAGPMVVEGRDIGTVVFPDATLKVFLRADLSVRAGRRREDLRRQGIEQSEDQVAREMAERDERDAGRAEAPLRQPEGSLVVDTSGLAVEQEVEIIVQAYRRALSGQPPTGAGAGPSPVE